MKHEIPAPPDDTQIAAETERYRSDKRAADDTGACKEWDLLD